MASYELRFKRSVAKELRAIPNRDVKKILACIDRLADKPRGEGCIKLSGQERYRVRQGVYRIIYEIVDEEVIVMVVKVAHRSKVYQGS